MNKLVFGKDTTQNIVSIEVLDEKTEIFIEQDSNINSFYIPNKYWILAHTPLDNNFMKLDGSLHYQYGKQYQSKSEWLFDKKRYWRSDIYTIYDFKEQCMVNKGITYFKGMKVNDVSVLSFDIETTGL